MAGGEGFGGGGQAWWWAVDIVHFLIVTYCWGLVTCGSPTLPLPSTTLLSISQS